MLSPFDPRCEQTYHRRRFGLFALVAAAGGAFWLLGRRLPARVEIAGGSMAPGLVPGDWALVTPARRLRRGHVVVFQHPDRAGVDLVKRIAAIPGDRTGLGRRLGPGELFVLGDRSEGSTDSRTFGPIPERSVSGRVRLLYWPPVRVRLLGRHPADVTNRAGAGTDHVGAG
jgi:nickel-type superoxide dismutase maturation protease